MAEGETPTGGPVDPDDASPRRRAGSVVSASRSFATLSRKALDGTGYFKPLPPTSRLARLIAALGLVLGRRLAVVVRDDHIYLVVMAGVVGVTSGIAAALMLLWIERAYRWFPHPDDGDALRWLVVIALPAIGGLVAGLLRVLARRIDRPLVPGPPGVIQAITERRGEIDGRSGLVTGIGTGVTIASGGSVGHEGPSVAIGATVGSVLARFFGLRLGRQVALVGAGCAGGLAAAFNAPLAGVIFTVELIFRGSIGGDVGTMSVFIPLIVAAVAGTFTSHAIFGVRPEFDLAPHGGMALPELGIYVLLAVVAGVVGSGFSRLVVVSEQQFRRLAVPEWLKPAVGGLGVGLVAAVSFSNELLGTGRTTVDAALHGELGWQMALLLIGLKMITTALSFGSGGFGGVFMPSLFVGTCLGTLIGTAGHVVFGTGVQDVTAYALVGMGAIFGAMMHAPLTPIVMIFELTRDYGIILPLMLCCILSSLVARRIYPHSFYQAVLRQRGVILEHELEGEVMKRGVIRELMRQPERVLTRGAGLEEIRSVCLDADLGATFVVDDAGAVTGYLDGPQLARRMLRGEIQDGSTAGDLMGTAKLTYMYPHDTLAGAMLAFARAEQDVLPVVDGERRLVGVIRRGDLIAHYSDRVLGRQEDSFEVATSDVGHHHEELGLGRGVILERIVIGRGWAGRSLVELDLRGKTGVVVLEWRRAERVLPLDPKAPLREGDVIALAGTREQILRSRAL